MPETDFFPAITQRHVYQTELKTQSRRQQQITKHLDSLKSYWPDWPGPKVGEYCEVLCSVVKSLTYKTERYHYKAPCKLIEASPDGLTFKARIEYPEKSNYNYYNGEILELDITEIWPPVSKLS